jgi:type I restriction enzyme S subunit
MKKGWKKVQLGDVCSFKYGQMPQKSDLRERGYPVYSGYGVVGCSSKYHYEEPQIIVVARGVGGTGDIKMSPPFSFLTNLAIAVLPEAPAVYKPFLYYRLAGPKLWELRTGSAQAQITIERLRTYEIELPPLDVQRRIASILSDYDDLVEINRRRIALTEEMARRLFQEWFVQFRFPGHEDHAMADTPSGPIPEGWRREELGAICSDIRDTVLPANVEADTPYVGLEHIPRRSTTLDAWGRVEDVTSMKLRFQVGDVLFGKIRPYFHKVVFAPFEGISSSDAIVIRSQAQQYIGLVLCVASSDSFVAHSVATSNGTKMPRANWSVLARTPISIPPDKLLSAFNDTIVSWAKLAASLINANARLTAARDLLLPRLISDQLSVSAAARELEAVA